MCVTVGLILAAYKQGQLYDLAIRTQDQAAN